MRSIALKWTVLSEELSRYTNWRVQGEGSYMICFEFSTIETFS